ncbi:LysR family transcriptional regulator (plasmid) [Skermanella rosea]|uniref:LysR family transcriptional regulator n=1 Tax=Skermanella rosea TaxID=1817965 RepID=UPI001932A83C|nr:LysR family transcriptional regulator [Skermanella rosea]UEM07046.1 LysR family transcriptional regulator [Skermanella rosea]
MAEPFRNLAWDDFRLVKAIADAKGLPSAAQQLGINHSTVFRRLRQIETALGTPLFERHRVGYVPTAAGEEMVSLAARLDEDITAFTRKVSGREPSPAGELRVTTNDSLLVHLLTPLFALFLVQCPDMRLDVVLSNQPLNLSKRDADVAIRATDNPPETLVGRRAARIAWALYGRAADFPVPGAADPDTLHRRSWVSLGEDMAGMKVVRRVRENVPPERIAYRTNSVLGLGEAVEAGIGIAYLPCLIADVRPALVRLAPPDPELSADLWLLTHPDLRHAPRIRVFLDFMAAEIGRRRRVIEGTDLPIGQIDR